KNKWFLALAALTIISFFFSNILFWFFLLLFAVIVSKLIQIFFPFVVGFDWGAFACIFMGYYIHPIVALVFVSVASTIGCIFRGQHKAELMLLPIFGYIAITLFFLFFPATNIAFYTIGMILTVVYGITNVFFSYFFMGRIDLNSFTFFITLIINNFFLFKYISPYIIKSIGL
ncbi:MAG: hypothetical protein KAQ92_00815, partial [Candidatus Aenigmarchaeota archaeon]|nr:hypothetical protein [Candidatus Aenigmarchaeota archaeon]